MSAGPILERIDDFDNRLDGMRSELDQLRSAVEATQLTSVTDEAAADETAVPKEPEVASESRDEFVRRSPAAGRLIKSGASPVEQPRPSAQLPSKPRGRSPAAAFDPSSFSVPELFGARTLAWAGGLVTLLGVVFLFVLAADRGWVGPETRLALGGLVSIGLAGSAVYLRRRYGSLVAALSAMGVGLAAGYVTLAAASATYGLLPVALGVALASGLAAFAVSIALRWRSQILAAFALSGAMVALPLIQQGFTPLVGAFLALLFAGAAAVATLRGWRWLLVAAGVVSVIEVAGVALVAALENGDTSPWRPLALAGAFWLLGSGAGVAHALRHTRATPDPFSLAFILGAASLASVSAIFLLDGEALSLPRQGIALLAVAMTQLVAGTLVSRLRSLEIGAPLWGAGLVIGAIAAGQLLDGPALAIAWCGQALLMAWLAIRLIAYATLLAIYALGFEATPRALFEAFDDPAGGAISALLTALALAGLGLFAREWTKLATPDVKAEDAPPLGTLALIAETISESGTWLARAALALGTAFATYAASLGILALAEYLEHAKFDFSAAHVVVTAVWALVLGGVALVVRRDATLGPLLVVALGALLAKAVFFDRVHPASDDWPYAFLVAGIGIAWAAVAWSLPTGERGRLDATGAGAILASVGLLSAGLTNAIGYSGPGIDWRGVALLGLAAGYLALAEAVRARTLEFAALTSGVGVALAAAASVVLLDGTWLVLSWAGAAVGFGVLALDSGATRYRLGSRLSPVRGSRLRTRARLRGPPGSSFRQLGRSRHRCPRRAPRCDRCHRGRPRMEQARPLGEPRRGRGVAGLARAPCQDGDQLDRRRPYVARGFARPTSALPGSWQCRSCRALPARPRVGKRRLGDRSLRVAVVRRLSQAPSPAIRRLHPVRGDARQDLPLRPRDTQRPRARGIIHRSRDAAPGRRRLLPAHGRRRWG